MPIDPSIALQVKQPESPLDAFSKVATLQNALSQNKLAELQTTVAQRKIDDEQGVRNLLTQSDGNIEGLGNKLIGAGYLEQGLSANKLFREQKKAELDQEKSQLEVGKERLGIIAQVTGAAKDQASYTAGRQTLAGMKLDVSQIPEVYNPDYVAQKQQEGISAEKQLDAQFRALEAKYKALGYQLDVQRFGETQRHNRAEEGLTAAGHARADSRSAKDRLQTKLGEDGILYQVDPTGQQPAKPVIGPDGKPLRGQADPIRQLLNETLRNNPKAGNAIPPTKTQPSSTAVPAKTIQKLNPQQRNQLINDAKQAIQNGAPKQRVLERLNSQYGINDSGL